mmetsp:Transcript_96456/g.268029  ORF Transcript_96456/g.268029 Transcript_96456/m.268029 type:complete len:139 (-) Transcript_96456:184-600(-)
MSAMSAIEVTGVTTTSSRISLKRAMEAFGEVEYCHIGNRGVDLPIVRFTQQADAETALTALKSGQVWLDGVVIGGDWKAARTAQPRGLAVRGRSPSPLHMTSRELVNSRRGRSRDRERERDRDRSHRSRSRSRDRRRR